MDFSNLLNGITQAFNGGTSPATPPAPQTPPADNNSTGMFGLDPETMGLLGMSLAGAGGGNDFLSSIMMMKMFGGEGDGTTGTPGSNDSFNPVNAPAYISSDPVSLTTDKQALLSQLKNQAAAAYPNNPTMQQVAITQAIHESNLMGKPSQLAAKSNNYFGIKAPGTGGTVNMATNEFMGGRNQTVNAGFGRNNSVGDSFNQYRNLMNKPRYQSVLSSQNPTDAFNALQKSGYATDPQYANKLNNVYNRYVAPLY